MVRLKRYGFIVPIGILLFLLIYLLFWRWQVSQFRFFDVDEFTHFHWAANIARGERPYVDFFTFFTPGFHWVLTPLFGMFSGSPDVFMAGRVLMYGVFLVNLALIGITFGMLRSWKWALLPIVLLAYLPMPYDKLLEVRPDNLSLMFGLLGVIFQIKGHVGQKSHIHPWFWSGVFYAATLLVLVKMAPFVAVGLLVMLLDPQVRNSLKSIKKTGGVQGLVKTPFMVILGGMFVGVPFFLWLLTLGDFSVVWYSLTKLAFESNRFSKFFVMEPHLFFFPNGSFYGGPFINRPLLLNHAIWSLGIIVGIIRFLTPFITADGDKRRVFPEILLSSIFILLSFIYVAFYPLKHSQYLIPIAVFVVFYAADGLVSFFRWLCSKGGDIPVWIFLGVIAVSLWVSTPEFNDIKRYWVNTPQREQLSQLASIIPRDAKVFDLEGRMIFWKDAYYICCLPYGLYIDYLSRRPPPVSEVFSLNNVQYVWQGDTGRFWSLPSADRGYIEANFERVPGWGDALWGRK